MKIQVVSDLHLEFLQRNWPGERIVSVAPNADVLVLAGDIAKGTQCIQLFADLASQIPVVMVCGNHEMYHHDYEPTLREIRKAAELTGIYFLENDAVEIGDVRFLGCTLWTDYKLRSHLGQLSQMEYAELRLNDHRLIQQDSKTFTAQDALARHQQSRAWLKAELAKPCSGKTVVVTHHGPHPLSVHPKYAGDVLSSAFVSDLSEILFSELAPDLWLHGHVHDSFDYNVGRTRVVTNPAGYLLNRQTAATVGDFKFENSAFNPHLIVEI